MEDWTLLPTQQHQGDLLPYISVMWVIISWKTALGSARMMEVGQEVLQFVNVSQLLELHPCTPLQSHLLFIYEIVSVVGNY